MEMKSNIDNLTFLDEDTLTTIRNLEFVDPSLSNLNENQKQVIKLKLSNRINKDGLLILQCGESRSQHRNKNIAIIRIIQVLKSALYIQKRRIPTKTPKAVVFKRLKNKRVNKERKANRSKPRLD